VVDLAAMRDAM